jgi:molybdenum cofactor cytidylyltransferase
VIPAIILAAGLSSRMGRAKALLSTGPGGPTFVRYLSANLLAGGVADVLVVGRPGDDGLRAEVESAGPGVRFVVNADRPGVHAVMVTPVDTPLIQPDTVRALLTIFATRRPPIVRATYHGRHGHPVIFGREMFEALRHADLAIGAKAVLRAEAARLVDVEVDDPGVVHDIDEPGDYVRVFNQPL